MQQLAKEGADAIFRHYNLQDILAESFQTAHLSVQVEAGAGLSTDLSQSRTAVRTGIEESQPPLTSLLSHR